MKNIREKDTFESLRKRKLGFFTLRTRMVVAIAGVVLGSILIAFGITKLFELWLPFFSTHIPLLIQLIIFSLLVAVISSYFISKLFFNPIKELREGMQKIADGEFDTRLETKSSSLEIQELVAGFNLMSSELSSTEIFRTDFISSVSHEFKTPLAAIEGYSTLLQDGDNLDESQKEYVEKILYNTNRLSTLASSMLLLSKIENQSIPTNQTRFDLDEQIRASLLGLEAAWEKKEIEFDIDLEDTEYYGNEMLLHHVWDNLISNAVKFSPIGGLISIRLRKNKGKVVFTIEDSGPGISKEAQSHIFDKFYQGDTSHKTEGHGLGLALVKKILDLEGGTIEVENLNPTGCRFTVTLKTK